MKKALGIVLVTVILAACANDATDGDPNTDTTTMPSDPYLNADTVDHINRRDGMVPADTSKRDTTARRY